MNELTIDLKVLQRVMDDRGHYAFANRLEQPEYRAEKFQGEWTDELLKEYLEWHCGKDETEIIFEICNS